MQICDGEFIEARTLDHPRSRLGGENSVTWAPAPSPGNEALQTESRDRANP